MLKVDIRRKHYPNDCCAIRDLGFQANAGEFVAIVGPSGAGKTTLLKLISGLDCTFEGTVQLPAQSAPGFMFQEPRLMPWLTVQQNLALVDKTASGERLAGLLEQVGLKDCAQLYPKQLSGGMQRRVALLRAFANAPQLLLMDEPFQSLDAPTADQLRAHLLQLWNQGKPTVLFVTHHLAEALALADRVLFLSEGPAHIALDWVVDLPRPRRLESDAVQRLARELLAVYPDLLKGQV